MQLQGDLNPQAENHCLNGKKFGAIPLKSGTAQVSTILILFEHCIEGWAVRQVKELKDTNREISSQLSLFAGNMMPLYVRDPQNSTRTSRNKQIQECVRMQN